MPEESPGPIGAPDGDWLVHAPPPGEWLVAVAVPPDVELPADLAAAIDQLIVALGQDTVGDVDPLCRQNVCGKNSECGARGCGYRRG